MSRALHRIGETDAQPRVLAALVSAHVVRDQVYLVARLVVELDADRLAAVVVLDAVPTVHEVNLPRERGRERTGEP